MIRVSISRFSFQTMRTSRGPTECLSKHWCSSRGIPSDRHRPVGSNRRSDWCHRNEHTASEYGETDAVPFLRNRHVPTTQRYTERRLWRSVRPQTHVVVQQVRASGVFLLEGWSATTGMARTLTMATLSCFALALVAAASITASALTSTRPQLQVPLIARPSKFLQ